MNEVIYLDVIRVCSHRYVILSQLNIYLDVISLFSQVSNSLTTGFDTWDFLFLFLFLLGVNHITISLFQRR